MGPSIRSPRRDHWQHEASADIGGIAAAVRVLAPNASLFFTVVPITVAILALQVWGSYVLIRHIFRWLALALLAYIGSALMSVADWSAVVRGIVQGFSMPPLMLLIMQMTGDDH